MAIGQDLQTVFKAAEEKFGAAKSELSQINSSISELEQLDEPNQDQLEQLERLKNDRIAAQEQLQSTANEVVSLASDIIDADHKHQEREGRRSAVRVRITYMAAGFLFFVGAGLVAFVTAANGVAEGKDLFLAILPIAAAVVTYWFATRRTDGGMDADAIVKLIDAAKREGGPK